MSSDVSKQKGLFWSARKEHLPFLYFFGALHFGTPEMYPLPKPLDDAYKSVDVIAFETHLETLSAADFQKELVAEGRQKGGLSLRQTLAESTWNRLVQTADALGFDPQQLNGLKAWFCATLLTNASLLKKGVDSTLGLDGFLFRKAIQDGKTPFCLESPQEQLNMMAHAHDISDDMLIQQTLDEIDDMSTFTTDLLNAWLNGDVTAMTTLLCEGFAGQTTLQQRVLDQRNTNWFNQLEQLNRQQKSVLTIVGAGHLLGDSSLLALFDNHGYVISMESGNGGSPCGPIH